MKFCMGYELCDISLNLKGHQCHEKFIIENNSPLVHQ